MFLHNVNMKSTNNLIRSSSVDNWNYLLQTNLKQIVVQIHHYSYDLNSLFSCINTKMILKIPCKRYFLILIRKRLVKSHFSPAGTSLTVKGFAWRQSTHYDY